MPTDGATIDGVTIYNTCCLDGFLVMVFLTLKYNDTIRLRMQDSGDELDKVYHIMEIVDSLKCGVHIPTINNLLTCFPKEL